VRRRTPVAPGGTLGILGGGQLGRMTALAARAMGYRVAVLDPTPEPPASPVADQVFTAPFHDAEAAARLARACDVVTLEIEQIAPAALAAAAAEAPLAPRPGAIEIVQQRDVQKAWLAEQGLPVGPFRRAASAEQIAAAVRELGGRCFVKARFGGYDGRGQAELDDPAGAGEAFAAIGGQPAIVERELALEREISVLVARRPSGEAVAYPPAWNHHERRILAWSALPAPLPEPMARRAGELALAAAERLDLVGLLCVEMFLVGGELLVNELAPRPHNSYHASERACATSQFEQLVRAVCDLPLGSPEILRPAAIANLLGDLWREGAPPDWAAALEVPGVSLHLYGKREARPGRKMGHLSAVGDSPEQAAERVRLAFARLVGGQPT